MEVHATISRLSPDAYPAGHPAAENPGFVVRAIWSSNQVAIDRPEGYAWTVGAVKLAKRMDAILTRKLKQAGDDFLPGKVYVQKWGYQLDKTGTVPYRN